MNYPNFISFFLQHGETSLKLISDEMVQHNQKILERSEYKAKKHANYRMEDYCDARVNPLDLKDEFCRIRREVNHRFAEGQERKAMSIAGKGW